MGESLRDRRGVVSIHCSKEDVSDGFPRGFCGRGVFSVIPVGVIKVGLICVVGGDPPVQFLRE